MPIEFDDGALSARASAVKPQPDITDNGHPDNQATEMGSSSESVTVTPQSQRRSLRLSQKQSPPPPEVSDQEMAEVSTSSSSGEEDVQGSREISNSKSLAYCRTGIHHVGAGRVPHRPLNRAQIVAPL